MSALHLTGLPVGVAEIVSIYSSTIASRPTLFLSKAASPFGELMPRRTARVSEEVCNKAQYKSGQRHVKAIDRNKQSDDFLITYYYHLGL